MIRVLGVLYEMLFGCRHRKFSMPVNKRIRCLECGSFRYVYRKQWFRDRRAA